MSFDSVQVTSGIAWLFVGFGCVSGLREDNSVKNFITMLITMVLMSVPMGRVFNLW